MEPGFYLVNLDFWAHFSRIPAKVYVKQPGFNVRSFAPEIEMPAQEDWVFVSCWAFPCSSQERVGEKMQLYKNEIKGIRAIEWAGFPQALVVSNEGVRCEPAEDKLTEIRSLLDFMNSQV